MKGPGGRLRRRIADMTIRPANRQYRPPPKRSCDVETYEYPLSDVDSMHVHYWMYRGKYVHFAITQARMVDGTSINIARIDTCWGIVHEHLYDQQGNDTLDHRVIYEIPTNDGWEVVDKAYDEALDIMEDKWADNLRRWRGDRP